MSDSSLGVELGLALLLVLPEARKTIAERIEPGLAIMEMAIEPAAGVLVDVSRPLPRLDRQQLPPR